MKSFNDGRPLVGKEIVVFKQGDPHDQFLGRLDPENHTVVKQGDQALRIQPGDCWEYRLGMLSEAFGPRYPESPVYLADEEPTESMRFNEGKPMLSYFMRSFPKAAECVARVKELGAVKYDDGNWTKGNKPDVEYIDSMTRHLAYFFSGEFYDQDSGCAHIGHAIWNLAALFELNYQDAPVIDEKLFRERLQYWADERGKTAGKITDSTQRFCSFPDESDDNEPDFDTTDRESYDEF